MLNLIANKQNFSYVIKSPTDNKYGAFDSEMGEWDGMMKEMLSNV